MLMGTDDGTGQAAARRAPDRVYEGYIFDLDGTIYLGDALLPGAQRLVAGLRRLGKRVVFLTNNPTGDPAMYAAKLTRLGIATEPHAIINTVQTMTQWLVRHHPSATVFAIGEAPLTHALAAAGIRQSEEPAEIDIVIASYDRTFTYRKLQIAFDALWFHRRARLVTTNPDRYCPFPGGRGEPDAAAIVAAIEACTGVRCEVNTGKPGSIMLETAQRALNLDLGECVMVGDRLSTDIRMALNAGMASALVLTGETTPGALAQLAVAEQPTWVLERIDQLMPTALWEACGWTDGES
jgi:HAD superfamily hydrolase (TIGR01450 family)